MLSAHEVLEGPQDLWMFARSALEHHHSNMHSVKLSHLSPFSPLQQCTCKRMLPFMFN